MPENQKEPDKPDERITAESEPMITIGSRAGQWTFPDDGLVAAESEPMFTWIIDCSKRPDS
jgi:hypothetical protein